MTRQPREELDFIIPIYLLPHIRERFLARPQFSDEHKKTFIEKFNVEHLENYKNWTDQDVDEWAAFFESLPELNLG